MHHESRRMTITRTSAIRFFISNPGSVMTDRESGSNHHTRAPVPALSTAFTRKGVSLERRPMRALVPAADARRWA